MTKTKIKFITLFLATTIAVSLLFSLISFGGNHANAETVNSEEEQVVLYSSTAPEDPIFTYTRMNTAVKYDWYAGDRGDMLELSNGYDSILHNGKHYTDYVMANHYFNTDYCDPQNFIGRSYSSASLEYSSETIIHRTIKGDSDGYEIERYGFESLFYATACLPYRTPDSGTTVPTSYDKGYFVNHHNSKNGDKIVGTIWYDNVCADIQVNIPVIGYKSS